MRKLSQSGKEGQAVFQKAMHPLTLTQKSGKLNLNLAIEFGSISMWELFESYTTNRLAFTLALIMSMPLSIGGQTGTPGILQTHYSQQVMVSGVEGKLHLDLVVKEGFKVAKRPAPKLVVKPADQFEVVVGGFSERVTSKDPDYFGGFNPLELKIAPAKTTQAGKYSLEAKLTYFYCSEQEKYCSRSVETLAIPVEVVKK